MVAPRSHRTAARTHKLSLRSGIAENARITSETLGGCIRFIAKPNAGAERPRRANASQRSAQAACSTAGWNGSPALALEATQDEVYEPRRGHDIAANVRGHVVLGLFLLELLQGLT